MCKPLSIIGFRMNCADHASRLRSFLQHWTLYDPPLCLEFRAHVDKGLDDHLYSSAHLKSSEADYTWINSSYLLAAAASTPTWGKFSDIWGRKPVLLLANMVFLGGSLISALSINVKMLIGGRVIQGIGGGGLIILSNICISDLFSMR